MTKDDKNLLFSVLGIIVISTIIGGGLAYGIFRAWKKRVVFRGSMYGVAAYSRDSKPFQYWSWMVIYTALSLGPILQYFLVSEKFSIYCTDE
jgi:phosphate/sulfate permease